VKKTGYPNYFDDQRFGSFDLRQGFIAEKILKGHYNGALKIYLTHIYPEDKREEKERRRFFSENWGKWKECLNVAKTDFEQRAFEYLLIEPKGFVPLLQQISHEEMSLFFSAYQSFLWNEMMGRIIDQCAGERTCSYKGVTGEYLFFASLNRQGARYLKHLVLPTPASNAVMPDELTKTIYADVMGDHGMKPSLFNLRKIRQAFFKSSERKAVVVPQDLTSAVSDDELYDGKKKMGLRFVLPRGSYGTMFLKRITTPPPRRP
jgi:tRNA pseudouridine13 synthase